MTLSDVRSGFDTTYLLILPVLSLYFFNSPSLLDFVCLALLFGLYALNADSIVKNFFGVRGLVLALLFFQAVVGVFKGWDPALIVRDLISLIPILICPFSVRSNYKGILNGFIFACVFATLYQIFVTVQFGGRAHFHYQNSMIPFCNFLFFIGVYCVVLRKSMWLGLGGIVIAVLGVLSTGSKINLLILFFSVFSLLVYRETSRVGCLFVLLGGVLVLSIIAVFGEQLILIERILSAVSGEDASTLSRFYEVQSGFEYFNGNEVLGGGLGATITSYGRDILYFHFSPLFFLFKFGVLSLLFFAFFIFLSFSTYAKVKDLSLPFLYRYVIGGAYVIVWAYMLVFPSYKYVHMNLLLTAYLSFLFLPRALVFKNFGVREAV